MLQVYAWVEHTLWVHTKKDMKHRNFDSTERSNVCLGDERLSPAWNRSTSHTQSSTDRATHELLQQTGIPPSCTRRRIRICICRLNLIMIGFLKVLPVHSPIAVLCGSSCLQTHPTIEVWHVWAYFVSYRPSFLKVPDIVEIRFYVRVFTS